MFRLVKLSSITNAMREVVLPPCKFIRLVRTSSTDLHAIKLEFRGAPEGDSAVFAAIGQSVPLPYSLTRRGLDKYEARLSYWDGSFAFSGVSLTATIACFDSAEEDFVDDLLSPVNLDTSYDQATPFVCPDNYNTTAKIIPEFATIPCKGFRSATIICQPRSEAWTNQYSGYLIAAGEILSAAGQRNILPVMRLYGCVSKPVLPGLNTQGQSVTFDLSGVGSYLRVYAWKMNDAQNSTFNGMRIILHRDTRLLSPSSSDLNVLNIASTQIIRSALVRRTKGQSYCTSWAINQGPNPIGFSLVGWNAFGIAQDQPYSHYEGITSMIVAAGASSYTNFHQLGCDALAADANNLAVATNGWAVRIGDAQ